LITPPYYLIYKSYLLPYCHLEETTTNEKGISKVREERRRWLSVCAGMRREL
jgi:hypothetical protein